MNDNERIVTILQLQINDEVISQLETVEYPAENPLVKYIQAYKQTLEEDYPEIQIFKIGNHYLICEDCIYLAVYED